MKTVLQKAILVVACMTIGHFSAYAQDTPLSATQKLALSAKLYFHGLLENDALALVTAAALRKTVFFKNETLESNDNGVDIGKEPISWMEMLNTASNFAAQREDIKAIIEDARAQSSRGLLTGAVISKGEIAPFGRQEFFNMLFEGGAFAEVYSEGRSSANIDMFVYDQSGTLVCAQTDPSPISLCGWTPSATSNHKVVLENKSDTQVFYALFTN